MVKNVACNCGVTISIELTVRCRSCRIRNHTDNLLHFATMKVNTRSKLRPLSRCNTHGVIPIFHKIFFSLSSLVRFKY